MTFNKMPKKSKAPFSKGMAPPKQIDFANKKPMMKVNKQAPMLGVPRGKK